MIVSGHYQSGFKQRAVRGRGWSVIRGGLGRGPAPGGTTLPTSGPSAGTLPARGGVYQTTPPARTGAGLTPVLPHRLPAAGTPQTSQPPAATSAPACVTGTYWDVTSQTCIPQSVQTYANLPTAPVTPPCPTGTSIDPTSGQCVTTTSYLPWILGGAGVVILIVLLARRR